MDHRIQVSNVSKRFYSNDCELLVLQDLNLELKKGEILGILGPSGSGKSTILNILAHILEPTTGEVKIDGQIGYMFQRDHLLEWRTIRDNVMIGLEIQKKVTQNTKNRIDALLKTYGLWEFKDRFPKELSGGMRQRAALIRTLSTSPDILLLDEPFSALDYQTRLLVSDDIYQIIKKEKKEAILVTHDIAEAISIKGKHFYSSPIDLPPNIFKCKFSPSHVASSIIALIISLFCAIVAESILSAK